MTRQENTKKVGKVTIKNQIRKNQILQLLLKEGMLSPSEVTSKTELTLPMSSSLMKELAKDGYIKLDENNYGNNVGRPPTSYSIDPEGGFFIGVEIGLRKTRVILLDLQNKERHFHSQDTLNLKDSKACIDDVISIVKNIIKSQKIPQNRLFGIGLAVPGLVNNKLGRSISYFNDLNMSLKEYMVEALGVNVEIENDVNAMSLGEKYFGDAKDVNDALAINLDKGIGMGLIINGALYTGANGLAGELGHIRFEDNNDMCYCGKRGCLELYASGEAISNKMKDFLANNPSPRIQKILSDLNKEEVDLDAFVEIVLSGDQIGIEYIEQAGTSIGRALGVLINLFNPQKIILGGKLSQLKEYILFPVKSSVIKHSLPESFAQTTISYSKIRRKAGSLGATTLVSNKIFLPSKAALQYV
ncbi:ROK family protein [Flammeovirga yaeyamensis]|uniref:ROK family protein n=1 Tax=Flammeovirga yaeyamensis TaxID=367791 RepID=A0AAX1NB50_9BACT|nr:ROK family protein [Flammeovirga yaeyamensis]MBB3698918.1 putative NBD/HSP70 family sugar kinase [Flammeovirga yaeyamensis]NMF36353.1 ROK family transcriptional regulator [Flammeovirga yaeyamensis]QWG03686.1 ROK family protein [Flammeovirga yaeyamensis]